MNTAIVAAAGQGTRMGGRLAKQFLELDGVPIIIHTLRRFEQSKEIDQIVVVVPGEDAAGFLTLADRYSLTKLSRVVQGGPTRAQSVWRGLQSLRPATAQIVAVHDGVRPFVTPDEIDLVVRTATMTGAAVLAAPVTDTIKQVSDGQVIATFERTSLRRALTPQCFRYEVIRRAFEQAESLDAAVTDESYLVERLGLPVAVVEGSPHNIKITSPEDLAIGEYLLRMEKSVKG
jgi:2-C-methyl-D-erythritol 4-phosphate cytidylyltransferase